MTDTTPAGPEPRPTEGAVPGAPPTVATAPVSPVEPARPPGTSRAGYLAVALLGIVLGVGGTALAATALGRPSPSATPSPSAAPADNVVGAPAAPVTVEVWADYQCPYCRLESLLFGGALYREYVEPGTARIVYRDFAFLGQESIDAAVAARCAGRQEPAARLRFHDALYVFQQGENEGRFARENLVQLARVAGVPDAGAFAACLDDQAVRGDVANETQAGRNVGVGSTPTLRLHGPGGERVLTGFSQEWPALRDAIEAVRAIPASPGPSASPSAGATP